MTGSTQTNPADLSLSSPRYSNDINHCILLSVDKWLHFQCGWQEISLYRIEGRKKRRKGWKQCRVSRSVSGFYGTKQLIKFKLVGTTRYLTRHECNEEASGSIQQTCQTEKTTKQWIHEVGYIYSDLINETFTLDLQLSRLSFQLSVCARI